MSTAIRHRATGIAGMLFAAASIGSATAQQRPPIGLALTSDNRGELLPCGGCGAAHGLGGLARRAAVFAELASRCGTLLRVDAGHALFGDEPARATVVRDAYDALGYDVVHVGWRDLRAGVDALRGVLDEARFRTVSANLLDRDGQPLFEPFATVQVGAERVAFVGATEEPPGRQRLPHLRRQLDGVTILDPVEALGFHIPVARAAADRVVLLYYGSATGLKRVLDAHAAQVDAVLVGGIEASAVPPLAESTPVLGSLPRGRGIAFLGLNGTATAPVRDLIEVDGRFADAPEVRAAIAAALVTERPTGDGESSAPPTASAANRALRLTVHRVSIGVAPLSGSPEPVAPRPGRAFLTVELELENRMPGDLVFDLGYPEDVSVPDLADKLFATVGADTVVRLFSGRARINGHLPDRLSLPRAGATSRGLAVFELPSPDVEHATLHWFGTRFAPIEIQLEGDAQPAAAAFDERGATDLIELGVRGFHFADDVAGTSAPDGQRFAVVELCGRSLLTRSTDARALARDTEREAVVDLPLPFAYPGAERALQLLVDGDHPRLPSWDLGTLDPKTRFFPGRFVGGTVAFLVPMDAAALELVCSFPPVQFPGTDRGALRLETLRLRLWGEPADDPKREPLDAVLDDVLQVELLAVRHADAVGTRAAGPGQRFAVATLAVTNTGLDGGLYRPFERFRLDGDRPPHSASRDARRGPPDELWVPAGERRSFELAFEVPAGREGLALTVSTVTLGLRVLRDGPAGVATPRPHTTATGSEPSSPVAIVAPPSDPGVALTPRGLAGVNLTSEQVNAAIDRGRSYLWGALREELSDDLDAFPVTDKHLLAALALVHAELSAHDPEFDAMLRQFLRAPKFASTHTYALAIFTLLVDAYGDPSNRGLLRAAAESFVDGQHRDGSWDYNVPKMPDPSAPRLPAGELLAVFESEPDLDTELQPQTAPFDEKGGDNSTTQFAMLALRTVQRAGIVVPADTWQRARALFLARRGEDGGWAYRTGSSYGSMTCAGICSVLLADWGRGADPAPEASVAAIDGGIAWLDERFSVSTNPKRGRHVFYNLYSLERTGRLLGREFLGRHEWYPLGARHLVDTQLADGSWEEDRDRIIPTAFALLFLTRATPSLEKPAAEGPATLVARRVLPAPRDLFVLLDSSGSMLDAIGGIQKIEAARAAVRTILAGATPGQLIGLRAYGHRYSALDARADSDTELLLPGTAADPSVKERVIAQLDALRARGKTPLALSLSQVSSDLRSFGRGEIDVVVLTDGAEDTSENRDPLAAAARLVRDARIRLHVIGFDVEDAATRAQLRAIAAAAGDRGFFWPAGSAEELEHVVRATAGADTGSIEVVGPDDVVVETLEWDQPVDLPAGAYRLRTELFGRVTERAITLKPATRSSVVLDLDRARVALAAGDAERTAVSPGHDSRAPSSDAPQFCTQCGTAVGAADRFCTSCGRRVR